MNNPNRHIKPSKLLVGLGIIGDLFEKNNELPVTHVRKILEQMGFSNNEIGAVFYVIRDIGILGARVVSHERKEVGRGRTTSPIWTLMPH